MLTKAAIRKRTQRANPLAGKCCESCGSKDNLQRHHRTYSENDFEILCQPCHVMADLRDGSRRQKQTKNCAICGNAFTPSHSKKHATCSKPCLSELGRRNANKRWHSNASASTDLEASAMPSSPK